MRRLLWLSLCMLLAGYGTLGYFLSRLTVPWVVWVAVMAFALVQSVFFSSISKGFKTSFREWFSTEAGHFTVIAIMAFGLAFVLVWFHIFQYALMIGAAELLARVELQYSSVKPSAAVGILTSIALMGLATGWTMSAWG
jgi:hypothetical protein